MNKDVGALKPQIVIANRQRSSGRARLGNKLGATEKKGHMQGQAQGEGDIANRGKTADLRRLIFNLVEPRRTST